MSKTTNKFSPEIRERAVRLVLDSEAARAIDGMDGSCSRRRVAP
jgi:transposase-like protein